MVVMLLIACGAYTSDARIMGRDLGAVLVHPDIPSEVARDLCGSLVTGLENVRITDVEIVAWDGSETGVGRATISANAIGEGESATCGGTVVFNFEPSAELMDRWRIATLRVVGENTGLFADYGEPVTLP